MGSIDDVMSVNFVGSFLSKSNFSDIDIVVITKKINKKIINQCHKEIKKIDYKPYRVDKKILINDTFGPLKFNTKKNLVFHLMIYSQEDHIKHVINSPFTCYDWEITKSSYGLNLKDIYPVSKIFASDFFCKNRGINIYKKNLINKKINYKKYIFKKNSVLTKSLNYKIIDKDVYEFCYHVITFTLKNYLKYITQKNKIFTSRDIIRLLNDIYSRAQPNVIIEFYKKLETFKKNGKIDINQKTAIDISLNFLTNFQIYLKKHEKNSINLDFKRHFNTKYKKEFFIGQKINPPILKQKFIKTKKEYDISYSSPSLRCIQTSRLFSSNNIVNNLLKEINYGDAEGLTYKELNIKYPQVIKSWENKKDIKFPKGESSNDVCKRVLNFIKFSKNFKTKKKYLIITHNVFLRCLIGNYFNIPISKWYLINIDYGENINFKIFNKKLFINISRQKFRKIFKKIHENSDSNKIR